MTASVAPKKEKFRNTHIAVTTGHTDTDCYSDPLLSSFAASTGVLNTGCSREAKMSVGPPSLPSESCVVFGYMNPDHWTHPNHLPFFYSPAQTPTFLLSFDPIITFILQTGAGWRLNCSLPTPHKRVYLAMYRADRL